jgi:hypothetical protein
MLAERSKITSRFTAARSGRGGGSIRTGATSSSGVSA